MRLAISNLAWDVAQDAAVAELLRRHAVDAIDLAPGKYFSDFERTSAAEVQAVRRWWADRGLSIVGLQALLFGTQGLNLFGAHEVQQAMLHHFEQVCRLAQELGAKWLVFGAPKNRDRSALVDADVLPTAVSFFRRLGDIAGRYQVGFSLEANPVAYGCNFMTTTAEAAAVVREVNHPAIRLQFDSSTVMLNGETDAELAPCLELVAHAHASEPHLKPLGEGGTDHPRMARLLASIQQAPVLSIEMLTPADDTRLSRIEAALRLAHDTYRAPNHRLV